MFAIISASGIDFPVYPIPTPIETKIPEPMQLPIPYAAISATPNFFFSLTSATVSHPFQKLHRIRKVADRFTVMRICNG